MYRGVAGLQSSLPLGAFSSSFLIFKRNLKKNQPGLTTRKASVNLLELDAQVYFHTKNHRLNNKKLWATESEKHRAPPCFYWISNGYQRVFVK